MYLHQKDSPAASILLNDHFFIILGTYLFAIFLFKTPVLLITKHKHSHCHTQKHRHTQMMTAIGIAIFIDYYKVKPYPHCLHFMLVEIPSICESLLISINDTSIYLGAYARNVRVISDTSSVPQNPHPSQSFSPSESPYKIHLESVLSSLLVAAF